MKINTSAETIWHDDKHSGMKINTRTIPRTSDIYSQSPSSPTRRLTENPESPELLESE
jgi:hypothetical protein